MSDSSGIIIDNEENDENQSKDTQKTDSWQNLSNETSEDTERANIEIISAQEKSEISQNDSTDYLNVDNNNDEELSEDEIFEKNLEIALKHKSNGNNFYKLQQFEQALDEYSLAIRHCPNSDEEKEHLSIFYANRSACYIAMEEWDESIQECTLSIAENDQNIKAYWRRAKSYEKLNKFYDAKCDYNSILSIDENHEISKANLQRIEPLVQQQFEEQKEEVMGKLKGFANWGLGKLGLSLDNFEAKQDPQTGAYNINFKQ